MFLCIWFFFFNDTATTEIYTLSLHDALPIWRSRRQFRRPVLPRPAARPAHVPLPPCPQPARPGPARPPRDRKSTRLNSSHANISYAVFCLKKKKKIHKSNTRQTSRLPCVKNK